MAYQGPPGQPSNYGPPGYGPPPGYGWPRPVQNSGYATASLVFGILGILGGWCMFGLPCLVAIVTGHFGLAETKNGQKTGNGSAIAGLILGYIGVIPMALITFFVVLGWFGSSVSPPASTPGRTKLTVTQPAGGAHVVTFSAEGRDGAKTAENVTYNVGASIGQESGVPLPYSKTVQASEDATVSLWVQNAGTAGSVSCRIKVDGKVVREATGEGPYGVCSVRADSLGQ